MAGYVKGKDGKFAGSVGEGKAKVPSAAPDRDWRTAAERAEETTQALQAERFRQQLDVMTLGRAADRLLGADDRLEGRSGLGAVSPQDEDAVAAFAAQHPFSGCYGRGFVERGPAGAVVMLWDSPTYDRSVVAVVKGDGSGGHVDVQATVATTNTLEAYRMYEGAAREAGYMSGSCSLCNVRGVNSVGFCSDCDERQKRSMRERAADGYFMP